MLVTTVPQHQSNGAYLENYRCNADNYAQSRARKPASTAHFPSARDSGDDARRIGANIKEQKAPPTGECPAAESSRQNPFQRCPPYRLAL